MAFNTTTLAAAVAVNENTIKVTSGTGFVPGAYLRIDNELMRITGGSTSGATQVTVMRGVEGTATASHPAGTNVTVGLTTDLGQPEAGSIGPYGSPYRVRQIKSYGASGAIALPLPGNDMVAVIDGTSALSMTVAAPGKDQDGDVLYIIGNGKSASTVTFTPGFGNAGASYDVLTMQTAGQVGFELVACNGVWVLPNAAFTGTSTAFSGAIS